MAGVKGMKGGGGARPGAGRKPKPVTKREERESPIPQGEKDMLQFLQDVALGRTDATGLQVRAAIAAVQYTHTKRSDGGKKEEQAENAKKAAGGKFAAASTPPKLIVNNK